MISHQLQPGGIGFTSKVSHEVFLTRRFENAGVGEGITRKDAEERYDVRVG